MAAAIGLEFAVVAVTQQSIVVRIRFEVNAAAVAAVTSGRPAPRHKFFTPKCYAAVTAIAGLHVDFGFINKHVDSASVFPFAAPEKKHPGARNRERQLPIGVI